MRNISGSVIYFAFMLHYGKTPIVPEIEGIDSPAGYAKFRIPIPSKADAVLYLPRDIDSQDWEMVKVMLDAYVSRLTKE